MFSLYLLLVLLPRACKSLDAVKPPLLRYANLGDNVTLACFYQSNSNHLSWYKQAAGGKPQLMSYYYKDVSNTFERPFNDDPRFSVEAGVGYYHLKISNVQQSDSAMYYCGTTIISVIKFDDGIFLVFKESSHRSFIQQPVSESVQPGGSVTLNCTVDTGTSDGEHSVHWFRYNSGDFHLGIMYTHGHRDGRCEKSFESLSPAQSCVYSLPKRNISLSDDGMYYCAVASCGEILFGNGTRLNVGGNQNGRLDALLVWIYWLGAALVVSFILILALACTLYDRTRRGCLQSGGPHPQPSGPDHTADHKNEESDTYVQYVALDFKKKAKARRQKSAEEKETTYSGLRQPYLD